MYQRLRTSINWHIPAALDRPASHDVYSYCVTDVLLGQCKSILYFALQIYIFFKSAGLINTLAYCLINKLAYCLINFFRNCRRECVNGIIFWSRQFYSQTMRGNHIFPKFTMPGNHTYFLSLMRFYDTVSHIVSNFV